MVRSDCHGTGCHSPMPNRYAAFVSYAHHYQGWVSPLRRNLEENQTSRSFSLCDLTVADAFEVPCPVQDAVSSTVMPGSWAARSTK